MRYSPALARLVDALRLLPGIGPKSAQRMAFHLLERRRDGAQEIVEALGEALELVGKCQRCRMLTDGGLCPVCADPRRDASILCVVESPADVIAVEQSGGFRGRYFVLNGRLSPLDGVGPTELGLQHFEALLAEGGVREVILATNATVEGQATAHVVGELTRQHGLQATRIAQGVPMGGELETVDGSTLAHALAGRQNF